MQATLSDRAFHLIQGTTDSEMMFAMFVTHFERIVGEKGTEDEAYEAKDNTQNMATALREMLHEVHRFALAYENSVGAYYRCCSCKNSYVSRDFNICYSLPRHSSTD